MNKKLTKRIVAGGFALLLSTGLVLPTYAASATNTQTTTDNSTTPANGFNLNDSNLSAYLKQIDWNQLLSQLKGAGGQVQQQEPSKAPQTETKPAQPAPPQPEKTQPQAAPEPTKPSAPEGSKPAAPAQQTDNAGANQSQTSNSSDFVKQVITLVNQERAKENLKPLTEDSALSNMALVKAQDMSQNNYFDHTSPTYGSPFDMMKKFNISFSYAGENIAKGQKTPQEVMTAWMNSSGHRANIMNANYTVIGVGYYNGCWVQEFVGR